MSKEKQIEEMAKMLSEDCGSCEKCMFCGATTDGIDCTDYYYAQKLYNAGYRKQSEGEWLLEREPNGKPYCFHCSVCDGDFHHIGIRVATKFCPNCGAKMKGV